MGRGWRGGSPFARPPLPPLLLAPPQAYVGTQALLAAAPSTPARKRAAWEGWKEGWENKTIAKLWAAPNATAWKNYTDPLAAKGEQIKEDIDAKLGPEVKGWKAQYEDQIFDRTMAKIVPDSKENDPLLAALNDKLAPYNIEARGGVGWEGRRLVGSAAATVAPSRSLSRPPFSPILRLPSPGRRQDGHAAVPLLQRGRAARAPFRRVGARRVGDRFQPLFGLAPRRGRDGIDHRYQRAAKRGQHYEHGRDGVASRRQPPTCAGERQRENRLGAPPAPAGPPFQPISITS